MQMEKPNTNTPPTPSVPSMPPSGSCQPNQGTYIDISLINLR